MAEAIATVGGLAGACHYDGSDWVKSNLLFGFNAHWDENLGGTAGATTYSVYSSTVPANEIWILYAIAVSNDTSACGPGWCVCYRNSGGAFSLDYKATMAQYAPCLWSGTLVLGPGDKVRVLVINCTVGDTMAAGLSGYKMKINL